MSGYEVDLKRRREEDTRTIDECEEELNSLKEQLTQALTENARLHAEQAKDRKTIKQLQFFEQTYNQFHVIKNNVSTESSRLFEVSYQRALVGHHDRRRDGHLSYVLGVKLLRWKEPHETEYIITVERIERAKFEPPNEYTANGEILVNPRHGYEDDRVSRVTVSTCDFTINNKTRKLENVLFQTNAHPQMFLFKTHPADQTFEGKGFISLLGHVMMLIACELDLVVSIDAETGTTQRWLERHYSDFKVLSKVDPRTGEVLQPDSKEPNGQDNFYRASGDYYGNRDAYVIYLNGGPQTDEQWHTVQKAIHHLWKPHINKKLNEWFEKAGTEIAMKFGSHLNISQNSDNKDCWRTD